LGSGTTAAELRFTGLCEEVLRQQRIEVIHELARVEAVRDEQQRIFQQARRQRETLESLRKGQLREYNRDAARREQRRLDDLFLLRASYLRRS
jgi:flagellar export protein FliJ